MQFKLNEAYLAVRSGCCQRECLNEAEHAHVRKMTNRFRGPWKYIIGIIVAVFVALLLAFVSEMVVYNILAANDTSILCYGEIFRVWILIGPTFGGYLAVVSLGFCFSFGIKDCCGKISIRIFILGFALMAAIFAPFFFNYTETGMIVMDNDQMYKCIITSDQLNAYPIITQSSNSSSYNDTCLYRTLTQLCPHFTYKLLSPHLEYVDGVMGAYLCTKSSPIGIEQCNLHMKPLGGFLYSGLVIAIICMWVYVFLIFVIIERRWGTCDCCCPIEYTAV